LSNKILHIVSFDVPYPADYGGVIDVFYKIKALHHYGVKIILHCFKYGRKEQAELNKYCSEVYYYPRNNKLLSWLSLKPFIVNSRINQKLLKRLIAVDAPILFEGHHCSAHINHPELKERKKLLREHNVEWRYYRHLAKAETKKWKSFFYFSEQFKLKRNEHEIANVTILPISLTEYNYFNFKYKDVHHIPVFHKNQNVRSTTDYGKHILYHGNLSVSENISAVKFIVESIRSDLRLPIIIAGKNPTKEIINWCKSAKHLQLEANPNDSKLEALIKDAQINILPSFEGTGIKLKLINALYAGKHCLVTPEMLTGTGLDNLCAMARSAEDFNIALGRLMSTPFTKADIDLRQKVLNQQYNNQRNAGKIIKIIWGDT